MGSSPEAEIVKLQAQISVVDGFDNSPSAMIRNWSWNTDCLQLRTDLSYSGMSYMMPTNLPMTYTVGSSENKFFNSYVSGCSGSTTSGMPAGVSTGQSRIVHFYQRNLTNYLIETFDNDLSATDFNKTGPYTFSFGVSLTIAGNMTYSPAGTVYIFSLKTLTGGMLTPISPMSLTSIPLSYQYWSSVAGQAPTMSFSGTDVQTLNFSGGLVSPSNATITVGTIPTYDTQIQKPAPYGPIN
jgi:hypothetical protein